MRLLILIPLMIYSLASFAEGSGEANDENFIVSHKDFIKLQFIRHRNYKENPELSLFTWNIENTTRSDGGNIDEKHEKIYSKLEHLIKITPKEKILRKPFNGTYVIRASLFGEEIKLMFEKDMYPRTNDAKNWVEQANSLYEEIFNLISMRAAPNKFKNENAASGSDASSTRPF